MIQFELLKVFPDSHILYHDITAKKLSFYKLQKQSLIQQVHSLDFKKYNRNSQASPLIKKNNNPAMPIFFRYDFILEFT